ncbi:MULTISPECIES: hypothetical protein [unclassified Pseudoalteromonas]|uniref:hypothetical protein n=1 Tax=unclassified Pseudoalteromonas TaxID=194690 RepID=UPI0025B5FD04|nr:MULTISPECIES: hypothetical protein [unclassified Pseudoalteromonas]MDN3380901.1 hypothetical protein [Pseudoalteromonas sp. APC 3893]MDN3389308.1 hypothetical protein [Pseudoalteromonas sp. APC 4017]
MFAPVNKVKLHTQRLTTLLKHRQKLLQQGAFSHARFNVIDTQLLNHLYTLSDLKSDAPTDYFAGQNLTQVSELSWQGLCELSLNNSAHIDIYRLVACDLFNTPENDITAHFNELRSTQQLAHFELLQHNVKHWQLSDLKALRTSVMEGKEQPPAIVKTLLFSQPLATTELHTATTHSDFNITYAALVSSYCAGHDNVSDKLFNVFAKTADEQQKAQLLALAGLLNDTRWYEPCALFCKANPAHCSFVLSHFVYKQALPLVMELMAVAVTQPSAYSAWLTLTDRPLAKAEKMSVVTANNAAQPQSGINLDDAEHVRQAFAMQTGEQLLMGISFTKANSAQQLAKLAGSIVQRVIAPHFQHSTACALFHVQQSASQWQSLLSEKAEGDHAA